jgi:hypothetical protein
VHRLGAVRAAQVDGADLAAGVVAVENRRARLPGEHLSAQPTITISMSTSSVPLSARTYSWRGLRS